MLVPHPLRRDRGFGSVFSSIFQRGKILVSNSLGKFLDSLKMGGGESVENGGQTQSIAVQHNSYTADEKCVLFVQGAVFRSTGEIFAVNDDRVWMCAV